MFDKTQISIGDAIQHGILETVKEMCFKAYRAGYLTGAADLYNGTIIATDCNGNVKFDTAHKTE